MSAIKSAATALHLKEAEKLLSLLAEAGLTVRLDPTRDEPRILVASCKGGVSISRGSFSAQAMALLISAGTVRWRRDSTFAEVTPEGRAHLQRGAALKTGTLALGVSPFVAQHKSLILEEEKPSKTMAKAPLARLRLRDENESPLSRLAQRKDKSGKTLIIQTQFQAGERLRADLTIAAMLPRTSANWNALGGGQGGAGQMHPTDMMLAASQRAQNALTAVGTEFSGVLMDVCGFLKGLEQIEAERSWPARSGKLILSMALNALAKHYGLGEQARGKPTAKMRQWGTGDYRPNMF